MIEQFLSRPVTPWRVSQGFGENQACVNKDGRVVGVKTSGTCPAGYTPLYKNTKGHNGLDIPARRWQPVYAAHDGIVTEVQTEEARGLGIGIVSDEKRYFSETKSKEHYKTRYWHFIALDVHLGKKVKTGDLIGYADSTGFSSGDHLHLELKPVKILEWENGRPIYNNVLQKNGFLGAVDPAPYMGEIYALDMKGLVGRLAELTALVATFVADWTRRR